MDIVSSTKLDEPASGLLRIGQAVRLLGVNANTLRNWERQGKISSIRIGGRGDRCFRRSELLSLLSSSGSANPAASVAPDQTQVPDPMLVEPDKLFQLIGQQCLSLFQASIMTGYHEDYLNQQARLGELKALKIGRNWITHRSCLDDFCKTHPGPYPHWSKKLRRRRKIINKVATIAPSISHPDK